MRGVKQAPQPHIHPMEGPLDARGNCIGCAVFDPATAGQGGTVMSARKAKAKRAEA